MSEQEKKQQRIYDLLNGETKSKFLGLPCKENIFFFFFFFLPKKSFLKKREVEDWTTNDKKAF